MLNDQELARLTEWFVNAEIPHGMFFDNGSRWCGRCHHTVHNLQCNSVVFTGVDKVCPDCHAVWPEFVHMYQNALMMGDEDAEFEMPPLQLIQ